MGPSVLDVEKVSSLVVSAALETADTEEVTTGKDVPGGGGTPGRTSVFAGAESLAVVPLGVFKSFCGDLGLAGRGRAAWQALQFCSRMLC